jgi:hypothetical protein
MNQAAQQKGALSSGWILVTGLLLLCITGTGLTWWNYSHQVFSTAHAQVVKEGGGMLITLTLPLEETEKIKIGHMATITVGEDTHSQKGRVVSVLAGKTGAEATVEIRLVAGSSPIPADAVCSVTIDTTVPPQPPLP